MIIQPVVNIPEICSQHGIQKAVISPGSRSAPITLAFARHPRISTFVIPDERSAGFIALGMAQASQTPVVSVCTSGTAAANFYPAIIEAYYQRVPLVVVTADRPPELIDQQDGQTIRQENIFQNHIMASYQFPVSFDHEDATWHAERMVSEAILKAKNASGPVHLNVPIREPFYPSPEEEFHFSPQVKMIADSGSQPAMDERMLSNLQLELRKFKRIMIVAGQERLSPSFVAAVNELQKRKKFVVVGDAIANIHDADRAIRLHDIILKDAAEARKLAPDLLITIGGSIISKSLKTFLRKSLPVAHWHVTQSYGLVDTFKSLTKIISADAAQLIRVLTDDPAAPTKSQNNYFNTWMEKELKAQAFIDRFFVRSSFGEFSVVQRIMEKIPKSAHLHLANSMPVRYANYFKSLKGKNIHIWSNRGTSGIDGCLSTAVGHALSTSALNILLIGDMSFFYDRNGLWHNHLPRNLRIVVLNNHGGGIFRLINGPKQLNELEAYFETKQKLTAANTARDFDLDYSLVKSMNALPDILAKFFKATGGPALLEVETDPKVNQKVYEQFNEQALQVWK